jgi:hypothetical protein
MACLPFATSRSASFGQEYPKITKAMKMVSAAKLRRAQEAIVAARPYAGKMEQVLGSLAGSADVDPPTRCWRSARPSKLLMVVLTSDRGLCGGFNGNLCIRRGAALPQGEEGRVRADRAHRPSGARGALRAAAHSLPGLPRASTKLSYQRGRCWPTR